jgi:hypothetical protein
MTSSQIKKELKQHDDAFLNSLLAYGVYTSRQWTLQGHNSANSNPVLTALQNSNNTVLSLTTKKMYELYTSFFMTEKFEPVLLSVQSEGIYESEKYGYITPYHSSLGDYEALNNLARAGIFRSKKPDGTYILHLSFRGTDTDARTFKEFVTDAYLDMSAYYDAFKPLEKAVVEFLNNPENNVSELHVNGHSLGGAMVPEFFKSSEVQKCKTPMKGFTYGAPGNSKKSLYSIIPNLYHAIVKGKFGDLGLSCMAAAIGIDFNIKDSRIVQYTHSGDLIPKVANLIYKQEGEAIHLEDIADGNAHESYLLTGKKLITFNNKNKNIFTKSWNYTKYFLIEKPKDFLQKAFTFQYHDMLRYIMNIEHKAQTLTKKLKNPEEAKTYLPNLTSFNEYKTSYYSVEKKDSKMEKHIHQYVTPNGKPFKAKTTAQMQEFFGQLRSAINSKNIAVTMTDSPHDIVILSAKTKKILANI